ncbi:LamG-like jellyroll fold domain-containing protein [Membranihabitans maritimus]|uniref:LamG-like jellyroll fold domain-containing protein n=1 Tax=Membranihabitans maritimus TaxID=2904244 RepID=UPI001F3139CD|nr:LamG-like jellyroll fold domain-containing protein [Membranihabitans maritimus]
MIRSIGIVFFTTLFGIQVFGQLESDQYLKAYYTFDNCDGTDDSGNNSTGTLTGTECRCGVDGQSLFFDGQDDRILFNGNVNEYFRANNFTISFYFRPVSSSPNTVLLSKVANCSDQTGIMVRYGNGGVAVQLTGVEGEQNSINARLNRRTCWTHLVIVRSGTVLRVYENGELIAQDDNGLRNVNIENSTPLTLGMGGCSSSLDEPFRGYIDELRVYNHPLNPLQIERLRIPVDELISKDTVIAMGDVFMPQVAHTCASQVNWLPSSAVSLPGDIETLVDVDETTTLEIEFDYSDCSVIDSMEVRVVNSDEIDCGNIPMPRAFTPNQDGLNDQYFITVPASVDHLISFEIYDKWNNRVFYTEDPQGAWDGTFQGEVMNPGVFLYKIRFECSGNVEVNTGEVLLLN